MNIWFGYAIVAASVALIIALMIVREFQWKKILPNQYINNVGIRYVSWEPFRWVGMLDALNVIFDVLALHPEYVKARERPFWIVCYGYADDIITARFTTGYTFDNGQPAPKPLTIEDAAKAGRVVGTVTKEKKWPWSTTIHVIHVKMLRRGDSLVEGRLSTGTGPLASFGRSEFFHEHAHHFVSDIVYGDENPWHSRIELTALMLEYRAEYKKRFNEVTSP